MTNDENKTGNYGGSDITILEGLEAVRVRPGMYIGSTGIRGLHHLVYEVVDNSVDEALAGYATRVDVTILEDGGIEVIDDGRGIPVDEVPGEGKSALEVVLTQLHAGGKFGSENYAVSGGLHGVGISVVNALSRRVDIEVKRDGFIWRQSYEKGLKVTEVEKGEAAQGTGTTVRFWPDFEIMEQADFDFETLRLRFQQMAFLNKGLTISLKDLRPDNHKNDDEITGSDEPKDYRSAGSSVIDEDDELVTEAELEAENAENSADSSAENSEQSAVQQAKANKKFVTYCYENGLYDYVNYLNKMKRADIIHETIIDVTDEDKTNRITLELAMQWTSAYSQTVYTFANTISTVEGGTHEEGFRTALTSCINKYARANSLLKEKDENFTGDDVREGLTAILSVKLSEPQFEGQTKTKLGNTEAKSFVQKVVGERFGDWLGANPKEAKSIITKVISASSARIAAKKAREATRRKSVFESGGMPDKLKDCQAKDPSVSEIFIVEGDSAGGSAIQGRNPYNQAILPLRGKILNVEKVRIDRAMSSDTIQSLITALGTSTGENFNIEKARYHKIVIMADADVDGSHIATLLLTFIFRYMPELITAGFVYIAMPPLYRLKWSKGAHSFVFTDEERDAELAAGEAAGRSLIKDGIQRYKGLGEMSYKELWDTTMDPEFRTLKKVDMGDALAADETFTILMGEEVAPRREFIQKNAKDVRFLDI